jgi:large subunit ribosomal protein L24
MQKIKHIKLGDTVLVIAGKDKGKKGIIIELDTKTNKVRVQGVGLVSRHSKARKEGEKSSIRVFERFIDVSNVANEKNG